MQSLFLIDGSWYLYRAYYGLPEMTGPEGNNVNVLYWLTKMMLRLIIRQPDYFCIARDLPKKTLRHQQFKDYKATRAKIEDDLKQQIPKAQQLIAQLGIPSIAQEWYEADDIIGTYSKIAQQQGIHTTIYSADKDLKQLLDTSIIINDPMKFDKTSDVQSFIVQYGFPPALMVDYLALLGDSSDNIPWVLWIGKKWAQKLVATYWDLDAIYAHIDQIKWATRTKLEAGKESAYYSKDLIMLMEVPWLTPLTDHRISFDASWRKNILVQQRGFASLASLLDDIEQKLTAPQQVSLFG